jgi:hypothetical protein
MHLGKERATGFVEEQVEPAVVDDADLTADLTADMAAAGGFGAGPAPGPEREHATAG